MCFYSTQNTQNLLGVGNNVAQFNREGWFFVYGTRTVYRGVYRIFVEIHSSIPYIHARAQDTLYTDTHFSSLFSRKKFPTRAGATKAGSSLKMATIWTILRLNPMSQNRYLSHIHEYHPTIETYVPHYTKLSRPHGHRRPSPVERPCYPGYVFARPDLNNGDHLSLIHTPIKAYYIRFTKTIESIPDSVISEIKRLESLKLLTPETESGWRPGQRVRVSTPTLEIRAIIVRLVAHDKMLVDTPFCQMVVPASALHRATAQQ